MIQVFTWGSGEFGRLGFKTETKQQKIPKQINFYSECEIKKVSLGNYHAVALTTNGEVFSWGRGVSGQLGHNKMNNEVFNFLKKNNDKNLTILGHSENYKFFFWH